MSSECSLSMNDEKGYEEKEVNEEIWEEATATTKGDSTDRFRL